jgi:cell division protein FtsW
MRFAKAHMIRVGIAVLFLMILTKIDYHHIRALTPFLLIITIALLFYVLLQPAFHGSKRSILLLNRRFQPSELMKLTVIFYLSAILAKGIKSKVVEGNQLYIHLGIVLGSVTLVLIEPDLGTAMVIFLIAVIMFFLSGMHWVQLGRVIWLIPPLITIGVLAFPYQRKRLFDFVNYLLGKAPLTYHVKQSVIALANGGFTGVGFGEGRQKLSFLPEPFSDFILASLGEELGFVGFLLVFGLMAFIMWRGIRIALRAPDQYGFLLASGITMMIMINALMNAGVIVHLLPTTGLPFPFLSYGGSSLIVHMTGIGILLNISQRQGVTETEHGFSKEFIDSRMEI